MAKKWLKRKYSVKPPNSVVRGLRVNVAKNLKFDGYQRGLASMVYKFLDKKSKEIGVNIEVKSREELAEELLQNLKKEQFILDLKIILGVLI